jgi:DNA-binding response OmpR family regulator
VTELRRGVLAVSVLHDVDIEPTALGVTLPGTPPIWIPWAECRRATPKAPPVLTGPGGLSLDPAKRIATRDGVPLELTRKEFGVLEELMRAGGAVVSSEELLERVWDENADPATTIVRVTVMTLRKKLGEPPVVDTVVGIGYRLSGDLA